MTPTERVIEKAKLLFSELFVITGPVDHYEENVQMIASALAQERKDAQRAVLELPEMKTVEEMLKKINDYKVPAIVLLGYSQHALSAFNALKERLK